MALPDDYLALLGRLGAAFADYERRTGNVPVLVGGAAVAIQTIGAFMSGDMDIVAGNDRALEECLVAAGFLVDNRPGRLKGGYYHPEFSQYGVEAVSGPLFDGQADRKRLIQIALDDKHNVVIPSFEDMIADRLGQYAVANPLDDAFLRQARLIFKLADTLDMDYLRKRVVEEGGDIALLLQP